MPTPASECTKALRAAAWLAAAVGVGWFTLLRWLGDLPPAPLPDGAGCALTVVPAWMPDISAEDSSPRTDRARAAARPAVRLHAPAAVDGGAEVTVTCALDVPAGSRGWIDLAFDPALLTLADASTRYEPLGAGAVRLMLDDAAAPPTILHLQFATAFSASGPAIVRISGGQVVAADGRPVGLASLPALRIVIKSA